MVAHEICPRCRALLPADAPEGLCPECLLRQSVTAPGAGPIPAGNTGPYEAGFVPPTPADLAYHLPHLEILEFVGKGGMGAVYRARQPGLDRQVAVKVLPPEVARDPAFAERFSREARSLARFNHPNIVTVYDFGETGGLYYILMEFVAGQNLRQLLRAGALSEARMLRIVAQVCDALQYAHDEGVVHRDIKPENILLDARGQVKIADFGLAKLVGLAPGPLSLTGSQDVLGTVYYMAPEQLLRNQDVDHRADLYSLGVVFYEMLTGELPVGRFASPGQRTGVDARLDAIVLRALESKPEHRYQDAAEIKRDVEAVLAGVVAAPGELPALAAQGASWPCVRFTIPHIDWKGTCVQGEMYRDEMSLILDFRVVDPWGSSTDREVRLPLAEIRRISCHTGPPSRWARWIGDWRKTEVVLKVHSPDCLTELPAGQQGRGRLRIHRADREAAEQLVASILRTPLPPRATPPPRAAGQTAALGGVRKELLPLALGLLLTAAAGLVSTVVLGLVLARSLDLSGNAKVGFIVVAAAALLVPACTGLVVAGAVQMLRLRSYCLCLAAALVAVLPWSPAWPLGLAVGIWAVVVLGRREVMLAFLREGGGVAPGPPPNLAPPGIVAGKLRAWWRSFVGYFVSLPGTRSRTRREEASPNDG
jgi:tRNA A-37 threonylcarbamoyl transferase component Bud32